jgi:hypothetical protein
VPPDGVILWGEGFRVSGAGSLPWLHGADVAYWGDSHGSAILKPAPRMASPDPFLVMDRETLLAHREHWGREPSPTKTALTHLTAAEHSLYTL